MSNHREFAVEGRIDLEDYVLNQLPGAASRHGAFSRAAQPGRRGQTDWRSKRRRGRLNSNEVSGPDAENERDDMSGRLSWLGRAREFAVQQANERVPWVLLLLNTKQDSTPEPF